MYLAVVFSGQVSDGAFGFWRGVTKWSDFFYHIGLRYFTALPGWDGFAVRTMCGMAQQNTNLFIYAVLEDMLESAGVEPEVTQDGEPEHEHEEEMHSGFMLALPVGGTATMKFIVTEEMLGDWEMGCFEQDGVHYDAGMIGMVSVTQ